MTHFAPVLPIHIQKPADPANPITAASVVANSDPLVASSHLYSGSCKFCHHHQFPIAIGEDNYTIDNDSANWLTDDDGMPFQHNYLVSLFSAPDMVEHLAQSTLGEDVYALPIHIQRLLCEAKEEVVLRRSSIKEEYGSMDSQQQQQGQQQPSLALTRLGHVRNYVWIQSGGDVANMMTALTELMSDEDELENVLGF